MSEPIREGPPTGRPRLAVIGSGHVGLVPAACFADRGHEVVAIDADQAKLARFGF